MHFSFQHPDADEVGFEVVDTIADADFAVVDAESKPAVKDIVLTGRVARSVFVGPFAPPGAAAVVPRPIDLSRIVFALAELAARYPAAPHPAPSSRDADDRGRNDPDEIIFSRPPVLFDAVRMSPEPEPEATQPGAFYWTAPEPAVAPAPDPAPAVGPTAETVEIEARHARKAAARTAARRARQAHVHTDPGELEHMRDVLVLDADAESSAQLVALLELFGFRVHEARNIAQAADILSRHPLVAAFLDIALDGTDQGDGLTLLQTIHDLPRLVGHTAPAVLTVTKELQPADRVRAALAGINSPLIKPVTRGDVARALEACYVTLPADARRL